MARLERLAGITLADLHGTKETGGYTMITTSVVATARAVAPTQALQI
jgi:hypothetical protein